MDLRKLEERAAQLGQAADQLLANHNATNGAKQEVIRIINEMKAAAQTVEKVANVVDAIVEPVAPAAQA